MLTRLHVKGFKNLVDVDVRFGPFTCIAGENGVGKSNLLDAFLFLGSLADKTLIEAALSVRNKDGRSGDVLQLFHRCGDRRAPRMTFEAEMIVPAEATDDLGQPAQAASTFLRYTIELGFRPDDSGLNFGTLELLHEELTYVSELQAGDHLPFTYSYEWFKSAVKYIHRKKKPFISTEAESKSGVREVFIHSEKNHTHKKRGSAARTLPRTVLSSVRVAENPTAMLARREMQSWRLLQLEPSALREPDDFSVMAAPPQLGVDGSYLPATLYRLAQAASADNPGGSGPRVYELVAGRLSDLIRGVRRVDIDRDEKRRLLTLMLTDDEDTSFPAQALSDGTLRFLALAALELDPEARGVICFEEPENGIHPGRIPAMVRLLKDIATDTQLQPGPDNPLRQVIVNTHSPLVVGEVDDADLLMARPRDRTLDGRTGRSVSFDCLPETWRCDLLASPDRAVPRGDLMSYLNPLKGEPAAVPGPAANGHPRNPGRRQPTRVIDRPDMRGLFDGIPDDRADD